MTVAPRKNVAVWDERRNSSRVFTVPPTAVEDARRALAQLRHRHPALVRWIEDGHPAMTEAQHFQRFGAPYKR